MNGKDFTKKSKYLDENDEVAEKVENIKLAEFFKDKIVFIGSTATGAHDLRNTPIDPKLPGVYAHMNLVNMLEKQFFFKPIDDSVIHSIYVLAGGMALLVFAMVFNNAILDLFVLIVVLGVSYYIDSTYYIPHGYELKLFYCFFSFISTYSWVTFLNFNQASAEKKTNKRGILKIRCPFYCR